MNILLAGGGTAGHIEPALNFADELRRTYAEHNIVALGTSRGLETRLVPARGYELELITPVPLPRRINKDLFTLPSRLLRSIREVGEVIDRHNIDVLVGFGGYVSMPAYFAARGRIPVVVHEANALAGVANKIGARFAQAIAETVPGSISGATLIGMPLRQNLVDVNLAELRTTAREFFGLPNDGPVVLVFGGSQGSVRINSAIAGARASFEEQGISVLHSVGLKNELPESTSTYRAVSYIDDMNLAYAAADFVICRSGAMTVAEITAVGLPACFVPFASGNGEQTRNAEPVVDAGGAICIADAQFTAQAISDHVLNLVKSPAQLSRMAAASATLGRPHAAKDLVNLVLSVINK